MAVGIINVGWFRSHGIQTVSVRGGFISIDELVKLTTNRVDYGVCKVNYLNQLMVEASNRSMTVVLVRKPLYYVVKRLVRQIVTTIELTVVLTGELSRV